MSKELTIWKPWDEFKQDLAPLDIAEPPCKSCKNWKPMRKYMGSIYDGITCCHAKEMFSDFSCFSAKDTSEYKDTE